MRSWLTVLLLSGVVVAAACSPGGDVQVVSGSAGAEQATSSTTAPATSPSTLPTTTTSAPAEEPTTTSLTPSTTTTTRPATTTTRPPTTTTTFPPNAVRLTLANDMPVAVDINIAPGKFHLAAGKRVGPLAYVTPDHGNDVYTVVISGTDCGAGSAGGYLQGGGAGRSATMRIVPRPMTSGGCDAAGPGVPYFDVVFERDGWTAIDN